MAAAGSDKDAKRPIIIKKKKIMAAGHHGGAWKVAYADFVTAMMAFFMVMWLVSSVSKEQKAALFDYFKNPSMESGKAPKPAPGQMGPGGASTSPINMHGGLDSPRSSRTPSPTVGAPLAALGQGKAMNETDAETARRIAEEAEKKQLDALMQDLKEAIAKSQALAPFKDQLLLDITPEGLRIQIVDAQNRAMFDRGSARLKDYTTQILRELAPYLGTVSNRLSLTGHTDTAPYGTRADYTNWELSADRANAARRALQAGGLAEDKIARVVGLSSSVLFDKSDPAAPINRRISIIVMTKRAEESALKSDVPGGARSNAADDAAPAATAPSTPATAPGPAPAAATPTTAAAPATAVAAVPAASAPASVVAPAAQPTVASARAIAAAAEAALVKSKKP
jgi:chemotaxis protein MotB